MAIFLHRYFLLRNIFQLHVTFLFPEEAVNEVKRQAVAELQKAVATAESKANELVAAERTKMERQLAEMQSKSQEEFSLSVNHQEESSEVGLAWQ